MVNSPLAGYRILAGGEAVAAPIRLDNEWIVGERLNAENRHEGVALVAAHGEAVTAFGSAECIEIVENT